jgi:hypothetical protein
MSRECHNVFFSSSCLVLFVLYLLTIVTIEFSRFGSWEKSAFMGLDNVIIFPSWISCFHVQECIMQ